jgi:hypothetical protein
VAFGTSLSKILILVGAEDVQAQRLGHAAHKPLPIQSKWKIANRTVFQYFTAMICALVQNLIQSNHLELNVPPTTLQLRLVLLVSPCQSQCAQRIQDMKAEELAPLRPGARNTYLISFTFVF